ncbi:MAG: nucleotidyltransferase domain-containing protein [Phycisphaerae bacterium]|nr:nucleotidyltransferase domain-containing protein [Phycisphaerae bacterium]
MVAIIENNKAKLIEICQKYEVVKLDVFGSVISGQFDKENSDLDFLVEFSDSAKRNRFDIFFNFQAELKELFGRSVDLVEPGGLKNPYFIESINRTKRRVYVAP